MNICPAKNSAQAVNMYGGNAMKEIRQIRIGRASGYVIPEHGYSDEMIIEKNAVRYAYEPDIESDINPSRKWSYQTDSPVFEKYFEEACGKMAALAENPPRGMRTADIGSFDFRITFADGTEWKHFVCARAGWLDDTFSPIRKMVPGCEYVPRVLLREGEDRDQIMGDLKE